MRRETVEQIISSVFALGFGIFTLGLVSFVWKAFRENNAPIEAYLIFLGLYLTIIALAGAKLLSRMLEV